MADSQPRMIGVYVFEHRDGLSHASRRARGDRYMCGLEYDGGANQGVAGLFGVAHFMYFRRWTPCEGCVAALKAELLAEKVQCHRERMRACFQFLNRVSVKRARE